MNCRILRLSDSHFVFCSQAVPHHLIDILHPSEGMFVLQLQTFADIFIIERNPILLR